MVRISIEGNVCTGKTRCLQMLKEKGYDVYFEDSVKNTELTRKYWSDEKRYAFGYYMDRVYNYSKMTPPDDGIHIYEGSPYTLTNIYGELLYRKQIFDSDEYALYRKYCGEIGWDPNIIVYLYCHPNVCYERCKKMNINVTMNKIIEIHTQHEIMMDEINCPITLYKVNAQENIECVVNNVMDIIHKLSG